MERPSMNNKEILETLQPGDECKVDGFNLYFAKKITRKKTFYYFKIKTDDNDCMYCFSGDFIHIKIINYTQLNREKIKLWKDLV